MRLGFYLPTAGRSPRLDEVLATARAAESVGAHSVWAPDHVILPATRETPYPYERRDTSRALRPGIQYLDPLTALAAIAPSVTTVRLATGVLVVPYRRPVELAHRIASLDSLSGGRALVGVGAGWMHEEFRALGVDPAERGARTDESLAVMRALWTEPETSFAGRFTEFDALALAARPAAPNGPPVWVGGNSGPALRRSVRAGDGWLGLDLEPHEIKAATERLETLCEASGRAETPEIAVCRGALPRGEHPAAGPSLLGPDPERLAEGVAELAEAGVSVLVLQVLVHGAQMAEAVAEVAATAAPALGLGSAGDRPV